MREILFRGRNENSTWIYGSLLVDKDTFDKNAFIYYICDIDGYSMEIFNTKTIGQYTGLTDKNGTRIFEGDVLKIFFGKEFFKAVVKFGYYNQTDQIRKTHLGFYFDFVDSESYEKDVGFWGKTFSKIEVIGNIHDNPELLNK